MKPLLHFVEWKKFTDEAQSAFLKELPGWGVEYIVAHPVWGRKEWESKGYIARLAVELERCGLKAPACHAFWGADFDLGGTTPATLQQHKDFLRQLTAMGAKTYTIHLANGKNVADREACWSRIRHDVEELLPVCQECGTILALENSGDQLPEIRKIAALVAELDEPFLGMCFDTGHGNCYVPEGWAAALEAMASGIVTCHLHDNYGQADDHNPPWQGNIDWADLVDRLNKCPRLLHAETESGDYSLESWNAFRKAWGL